MLAFWNHWSMVTTILFQFCPWYCCILKLTKTDVGTWLKKEEWAAGNAQAVKKQLNLLQHQHHRSTLLFWSVHRCTPAVAEYLGPDDLGVDKPKQENYPALNFSGRKHSFSRSCNLNRPWLECLVKTNAVFCYHNLIRSQWCFVNSSFNSFIFT